jgi:EPS-associated MarR family transcriptional regulator
MSSNKLISEESLDLMHILQKKKNLSQRQLAKEIGFSVGKVNYCLRALLDIGFIKIDNFNKSDQKLKYAYILTPKGSKQKIIISKQYIAKKIQEYEKLRRYI